jgi:hypothetical protein
MGESLKESLEAAFDEDPSTPEPSPVVDESPPVVDEPVVDDPKPAEEAPATEEPAPGDDRTAIEASAKGEGEDKGEGKEGEEVPATTPGLRPPSSWKPSMRDKFLTLPEDVQREVLRREVDISKGMEIAAESRKFKQEFDTHVAPYAAEIASRGVTAMDAFDNYLKTAYALRHAPAQEKAALVAGMIQQYGVDIGALDQVLTNQIENPGAPGGGNGVDPNVAAAVTQALQPYQQMFSSIQQREIRSAEQTQTDVTSEIATFKADDANEFFEDVKVEMGNFLEAAAMRSQPMTLQDAYDRAILLRPELAEIVAQRKLQTQAEAKTSAAAAAKAKAVGITGSSPDTGSGRAPAQSLRGAIEAAIDSTDM